MRIFGIDRIENLSWVWIPRFRDWLWVIAYYIYFKSGNATNETIERNDTKPLCFWSGFV
jgi:hypothetical protein